MSFENFLDSLDKEIETPIKDKGFNSFIGNLEEPIKETESKDGFIKRFGKQLYNFAFAQPAHELAKADVTEEEHLAIKIQKQRMKKRKAEGVRFTENWLDDEFEDIVYQLKLRPEARESDDLKQLPKFEKKEDVNELLATVSEAEGVLDTAADITAGITGFVTQLVVLKKAFPNLSQPAIWEIQNQLEGGTPGMGAVSYGALNAPSRITARLSPVTKAGKVLKAAGTTALESTALAGITALEQKLDSGEINWEEVAIAAGIPIALKTPKLIKAGLRAKNPKILKAISQVEARAGERPTGKTIGATKHGVPIRVEAAVKPTTKTTTKQLIEWAKTAKKLRKTEIEPAVAELRRRQAGRGAKLLERELGKGKSKWQSIKKSVLGYKDKANIPDVTPPTLSDAQWESYADDILKLFPATDASKQFTRTNTLKALDQLRKGKIPTNYQFQLLEPILGKDSTKTLYSNLIKQKPFSGWELPAHAIQFFKTKFGFDVQTIRQGRSLAVRHPKIYGKGIKANIQAYLSEKQAKKIMSNLEKSPGYKLSKKYLNYVGTSGYASDRLEYYSLGLTERLLSLKLKNKFIDKTIGRTIRGYGRLLQTSERGAVAGIDTMMKGLWDISEKNLANMPNMSAAKIKKYRINRGKTINTFMKILRAKNPKLKEIQRASNWILFSPSMTASRPLSIKALVANKGSRGYTAEIMASNIASIYLMSYIANVIGNEERNLNPTEEPSIDGGINILEGFYGKIRIGDNVLDFSGGDAPFYRTIARIGVSAYFEGQRLATGKRQTTVAGQRIPTAGESLKRYGETRETAALGLAKTLATGKDWMGKPIPRFEATIRAISPEIIEATYDAGEAEGLWEGLASGVAAAASVGTATYPVSAASTRKKFKNIIAKQEHGKNWDDLTQMQQLKLISKHKKQFDLMNEKVKIERAEKPLKTDKIIEEQKKAGNRIRKSLSKENKAKVKGISLNISRNPEKFYLNDERYQRYEELITKYLDERLSKLKLKEGISYKLRVKMVNKAIKFAKKRAFMDLKKEMK